MLPTNRFIIGLTLLFCAASQAIAQPPYNPRRLEMAGTIEFVGPLATTLRINGQEYRKSQDVIPCRLSQRTDSGEAPQLQRGQRVAFMTGESASSDTTKPSITQICIMDEMK